MEKSGASDVSASRLYLNIPLAGKTLRGDPLWNQASAERADCQMCEKQCFKTLAATLLGCPQSSLAA
ncbi:MAG: hypothetical protein ACXWC0_28775 [Burkholderiales bacterium]